MFRTKEVRHIKPKINIGLFKYVFGIFLFLIEFAIKDMAVNNTNKSSSLTAMSDPKSNLSNSPNGNNNKQISISVFNNFIFCYFLFATTAKAYHVQEKNEKTS